MAGKNLAHAGDKVVFGHGKLRLGLLAAVIVVILAQAGKLGTEQEVLDLDLALLLFVATLDHDTGRAALVGVLELLPHLA